MLVSSPTSAFVYLVGMAAAALTNALPALIVLTILAFMFIHTTIIGALTIFCVIALMFAFSASLGFMLSTFSTDIQQSRAFVNILTVLLSTIAPIYYPISYIPMPLRYVAYLSPTTYAAAIAQNAIGYLRLPSLTLWIDAAVLLTASAILFVMAIKKSQWREA
jgi:ABC-2 type transport system permease protein